MSSKGKKVPYFVRWSEKGGVKSTILTYVLLEMDAREMFDRSDGRFPFVLLDGHGSNTDFDDFERMRNPEHKWFFSIGVPHGTIVWQAGDSSEKKRTL